MTLSLLKAPDDDADDDGDDAVSDDNGDDYGDDDDDKIVLLDLLTSRAQRARSTIVHLRLRSAKRDRQRMRSERL